MVSTSLKKTNIGRKQRSQIIADELIELIRRDGLKPGDRLPSQTVLKRRYDASQTTVRHALLILTNLGIVVGRQGSGIFVAEPRIDMDLARPRLTSPDGGHLDFVYEPIGPAELIFATDRLATLLERKPESAILRQRRKMMVGTTVIGIETANFPGEVAATLLQVDLENGNHLNALARSAVTPRSIDLKLRAEIIPAFDAEILDYDTDSIVMQRIEVVKDATRQPLLLTRTTLDPERVQLSGSIAIPLVEW